ncbi:MAG: DUF502 domain-containing protein [Candidatus Aminicenantes bacterium]|nr:DUF502 domain-containing protein [Candidatus Aminicenantes bacterium]
MLSKKISKIFKNYFVTGIIVIVPLLVTYFVIRALVNTISKLFALLPPNLQPQTYVPFFGLEIIISFILIILIGFLVSNFLGRKFLGIGEKLLAKIPVVKTIYQGVKQLTTGIVSDKKMFSKVVLIQFPVRNLHQIGFVTGEDKHLVKNDTGQKMLKIFIPTTPNPTTGFFCIVPESDVQYLDLTADEAFRLIISAGSAEPEKKGI